MFIVVYTNVSLPLQKKVFSWLWTWVGQTLGFCYWNSALDNLLGNKLNITISSKFIFT